MKRVVIFGILILMSCMCISTGLAAGEGIRADLDLELNEGTRGDEIAGGFRPWMLAPILGGLVLVAGLVAWGFTHGFGKAFVGFIHAFRETDQTDAELRGMTLEEADRLRKTGKYMKAIELLREWLTQNPRDLHAGKRIAEIYENDLNNPLAAAMEYEEMLTWRMDAERWGWICIRASNLWSGKLEQPDKAMAILEQLMKKAGHTEAAKKAARRLEQPVAD